MAEDDKTHVLVIGPESYTVGARVGGQVGLRIRTRQIEALLPALDLVCRIQPDQARILASELRA